jgi:hypothetical protein
LQRAKKHSNIGVTRQAFLATHKLRHVSWHVS